MENTPPDQNDYDPVSRKARLVHTDAEKTNSNGSGRHSRADLLHKKQVHASSVNGLKKRIRDINRRLERKDELPAGVRVQDERALAVYQQELNAAAEEKAKQKMIKKYHMVRFFERQKATRSIRKFRKELVAATTDTEVLRLTADLHAADVDLHYTQYAPLHEAYVSIYPRVGASVQSSAKKPEMWYEVERRMKEGGLEQLRNLKSMNMAAHTHKAERKKHPSYTTTVKDRVKKGSNSVNPVATQIRDDEFFKLNRREKRKALRNQAGEASRSQNSARKIADVATKDEDEDMSDTGFFEE